MQRPLTGLVLSLVFVLAGCEPGGGTRPAPMPRVERPSPSPVAPGAGPTPTEDVAAPAPTPTPDLTPTPAPSATPSVGAPDADRAVRLARLLARDVGPRPAGSDADAVARLVVTSWLRDAGWEVEEQPFPLPQGGTTANLVATWDGRGRGEPHLVLGAHLDTVAGSPGGNDNASGVGALVVLARELADEAAALPVPVVLVAFGAEEYQPASPRVHHLGSDHYAEQAGAEVVAMLSIDMIGHGPTTCICWYDAGPRTLADRLAAVAGPAGFRVERRGDISDHGPFALRGIPAALLWTYMEPRLHSPDDTWEHLEPDAVARATTLAVELVRGLRDADRDGLVSPP